MEPQPPRRKRHFSSLRPPPPLPPPLERMDVAVPGGRNDEDNDDALLLQLEKAVCSGVLQRLFASEVSSSFLSSMFPHGCRGPQFLDRPAYNPEEGVERAQAGELGEAWCRFEVSGLTDKHFAGEVFPSFDVSVVKLNGEGLPRQTPLADMPVRLRVLNKWADVTDEVLQLQPLESSPSVCPPFSSASSPSLSSASASSRRSALVSASGSGSGSSSSSSDVVVLKDGQASVSGMVFHDISIKHGGYFTLSIESVEFPREILQWRSGKITIQSTKTMANQKRKRSRVEQQQQQQQQQQAPPPPRGHHQRAPAHGHGHGAGSGGNASSSSSSSAFAPTPGQAWDPLARQRRPNDSSSSSSGGVY